MQSLPVLEFRSAKPVLAVQLLFRTPRLQPTRPLCPWNFPDRNTAVGCHFLLQGIFPTPGSNLCLLHWQADSLPLSHQGSFQSQCFWVKIKVLARPHSLPQGSQKRICSLQLLVAASQQTLACGCITPVSTSAPICFLPFCRCAKFPLHLL